MSLTRKEFLRQGIFSLGKTALDIAGTLTGVETAAAAALPESEPSGEPRPEMVAQAFNERCLARSCGCFACVERCDLEAIKIIPGVGIRINPQLCNGCGTCEYVCPVCPKAVILQPRQIKSEPQTFNTVDTK